MYMRLAISECTLHSLMFSRLKKNEVNGVLSIGPLAAPKRHNVKRRLNFFIILFLCYNIRGQIKLRKSTLERYVVFSYLLGLNSDKRTTLCLLIPALDRFGTGRLWQPYANRLGVRTVLLFGRLLFANFLYLPASAHTLHKNAPILNNALHNP